MTVRVRRPGVALFPLVVGVLLVSINLPCAAQDFKPYPGSQLDEKASREAMAGSPPDKQAQVYTTDDAFDKVYAFYKGRYKESTILGSGRKLPSGQQIRWAFFILDGAGDLSGSSYWMKIQRPYVGGAEGKDIRGITVIQVVRPK